MNSATLASVLLCISLWISPHAVYFSSDETITTSDVWVASQNVWGDRGFTATNSINITIPSSLPLNTVFRIGVIIDPTNVFGEWVEDDNATRLNRRVRRTC